MGDGRDTVEPQMSDLPNDHAYPLLSDWACSSGG